MGNTKHKERDHSKYSASGSERWLNCPASVMMEEKAPEQPESEYAKEGTLAHECLEFLLKNRKNLEAARKVARKKYTKEMVRYCMEAAEYVLERYEQLKPADLMVETKVKLKFIDKEMFGTLDVCIAEMFGLLLVIDFKYGAGIAVDVEENSQLLYYALGIAHKYDYNFSELELCIIQPRAFHETGETIRSWRCSMKLLKKWRWIFADGVAACKVSKPKFSTGEWCKWCKAATICPEISTRALTDARIAFADVDDDEPIITPKRVTDLPIKDLPKILNASKAIRAWLDAIDKHAFAVMSRGHKVEGFKLVEKRATRQWRNEDEVEEKARKLFGDAAFTDPVLLSPTQLEKQLKDVFPRKAVEFVKKHVTKESTGLTVVREGDNRKAVNPAREAFKGVS